ncbi:MAG: mechanosensitive ion channel domain-containing protein [Flavobacteriaceae bacterium]
MINDFIVENQSELLATLITLVVLIFLRFIASNTVRRIGQISNFVETRTNLILRYVNITILVIGIVALSIIWSVNYRELGILFSSLFAVLGVALFASWSILSNLTAGIILYFAFPFKMGDHIRILDKEAESDDYYTIEDIKAFHVNLRKGNGELLVYPNNLMIQKAVIVAT